MLKSRVVKNLELVYFGGNLDFLSLQSDLFSLSNAFALNSILCDNTMV